MFTIALSFFLFLHTALCLRGSQSNSSLLKPSLSSGSLVQIEKEVHFSNCHLYADKDALYACSRNVYLFADNSSAFLGDLKVNKSYSARVDIDENGLIIQEASNLEVYMNHLIIDRLFYNRESLILAKVKSKSKYLFIATITRRRVHPPQKEQGYELDVQSQEENEKQNYYIVTYLSGSVPRSHRTRFPIESLGIELNDNSFREAAIYSDPLYGCDYFIVGLEGARLITFKSEFQDPEMNYLSTKTIGDNLNILEMRVVDSYLFVLMRNQIKRSTQVAIYKLETYDDFNIREECMLELSQSFNSGYLPQLRVKLFNGIFVLMVNFPDEKIVVYHFQKPDAGYLPLSCRKESTTIAYKDSVENIKIGYSFDIVERSESKGFLEHRILLSPITLEGKSTFYIPYCMPNTYRDTERGCVPCEEGFSFGGFNPTCLPCSSAYDKKSDYFTRSDIVEMNCPLKCDSPGKYGKICLTCPKYMESLKAVLPMRGQWGVNDKGECGLRCASGLEAKAVGVCLEDDKLPIIKDPCSQIHDCMNCSMSQTCFWSRGTCNQNSRRHHTRNKNLLFEDVLAPTLQCGIPNSCGQSEYREASGVIQFSADNLYKNQLCKWHIHPYDNQNNRIELKITIDDDFIGEVENLPVIHLQSFNYNMTGTKNEYSLATLNPRQGATAVVLLATELVLFPHIEENIIGKGKSFKIEYRVRPINHLLENILILFKWIYYLIFSCIAFAFTITSAKRLSQYYRKRRLLAQLQRIGAFDELDLSEKHEAIDVEKVLNNQKLVSKTIHDEVKLNKFEQTECSICLEDFKSGENLAEFTCNHLFHVKCFENWIKVADLHGHVKCPVCNMIII